MADRIIEIPQSYLHQWKRQRTLELQAEHGPNGERYVKYTGPFEVKPFISTHQVVDLDPNEWRVLPRAALPERRDDHG